MIPIKGMTKEPMGLPIMIDAWLGCVNWAVTVNDFKKDFKKETGLDVGKLLKRSSLEIMIDESTGFEQDAISKWCDWVTENIWGIKE